MKKQKKKEQKKNKKKNEEEEAKEKKIEKERKKNKKHLNISLSHRLCSLAGFPWYDPGFLGKCFLALAFLVSSPSPCCSYYTHRHTNS